ncbi:MAG: hypothetical protein ACOCRX_11905, partial [Candidatus Woesearchaeota archaeon]
MKKILIILIILMSLFSLGCENPKDSSSNKLNNNNPSSQKETEAKTGITGQLLIEDQAITNAKILVDDNIAKPDNDGEYTLLVSPGEYEMNIITLFGTTIIPVTVAKNELINVDKNYTYSDWGLED